MIDFFLSWLAWVVGAALATYFGVVLVMGVVRVLREKRKE